MIFFLKIQLQVLSIGLNAVFKVNRKLTKMMTSGLNMIAFVFINLQLILSLLYVKGYEESITHIVDSIVYIIIVIIIIELILYSMVSNMNTIAYDFDGELHFYHKIALMITQSLIIVFNIGLIVLLSILFTRAKKYEEDKGDPFNVLRKLSKFY